MRQFIKKGLLKYINYQKHRNYNLLYKKILCLHPNLGEKEIGEEQWLYRWKKLDANVTPFSYRIFSKFIGNNIDILPLETSCTFIEPLLQPIEYVPFYSDKNVYDRLFGLENTLGAVLRRINGFYYLEDYSKVLIDNVSLKKMLSDKDVVIVKPSVDSCSGNGVKCFVKNNNEFYDELGNILSIDYLERNYGNNFIIQKKFEQSELISFFNSSSVNTLRIMAYRSVITDEVVIPNMILRIGSIGSIVDNAHAGGRFIGVSNDGKLGNGLCDFCGGQYREFNGVDFSKNSFYIQNIELIKKMVIEASKKILHHRLIAFDIAIDKNNIPKILEINVGGFGAWPFQFVNSPTFGKWTDEVYEYSLNHNPKKNLFI